MFLLFSFCLSVTEEELIREVKSLRAEISQLRSLLDESTKINFLRPSYGKVYGKPVSSRPSKVLNIIEDQIPVLFDTEVEDAEDFQENYKTQSTFKTIPFGLKHALPYTPQLPAPIRTSLWNFSIQHSAPGRQPPTKSPIPNRTFWKNFPIAHAGPGHALPLFPRISLPKIFKFTNFRRQDFDAGPGHALPLIRPIAPPPKSGSENSEGPTHPVTIPPFPWPRIGTVEHTDEHRDLDSPEKNKPPQLRDQTEQVSLEPLSIHEATGILTSVLPLGHLPPIMKPTLSIPPTATPKTQSV